jgi:hypothetical protein
MTQTDAHPLTTVFDSLNTVHSAQSTLSYFQFAAALLLSLRAKLKTYSMYRKKQSY